MAISITGKRVSDPLDDYHHNSRQTHFSCTSSGSEHNAEPDTLSDLIYGFLETTQENPNTSYDECSSVTHEEDEDLHILDTLCDLLNPYKKPDNLWHLHSQITRIVHSLSGLKHPTGSGLKRAVMARLREIGYNAGICKSKWESSGNLTAGSYEYIDVTFSKTKVRYIVDLDFRSQFEIARATEEYGRLVSVVPKVVVGKSEELKQVVRMMSEASRRSLKRSDLTVPPWRKSRYMIAKWFGDYKRTVNAVAAEGRRSGLVEVKCREVGFEMGLVGRTALYH